MLRNVAVYVAICCYMVRLQYVLYVAIWFRYILLYVVICVKLAKQMRTGLCTKTAEALWCCMRLRLVDERALWAHKAIDNYVVQIGHDSNLLIFNACKWPWAI